MRRGTQAHDLGAQLHQAVVLVVGDVVESGVNGHAFLCAVLADCIEKMSLVRRILAEMLSN